MPRSLPHTKVVKAKGKQYVYFKTGLTDAQGKPIYKRLPGLKDPSFGAVYAAHLAQMTKRANTAAVLTVPDMIDMFERSPQYRKLSAGTHKIYGIYLRRLAKLLPTAPAASVERKHIAVLVDKMGDTPGAANMFLAATAALYKWGRARGHVTTRPTQDIDPFELGEHDPWPIDLVERALSCDRPRVRLAVHLLYFTAQRIGDVCKMRWSDIQDGVIRARVQKTKRTLDIPLHSRLAAELAATPRKGMCILTGPTGLGVRQDAIRDEIKAFIGPLGYEDLVPHGLRKNAVNALLEAGCSAAETGSISGQTLQMIEHYAKGRAQPPLARAAVLKWQGGKQ